MLRGGQLGGGQLAGGQLGQLARQSCNCYGNGYLWYPGVRYEKYFW